MWPCDSAEDAENDRVGWKVETRLGREEKAVARAVEELHSRDWTGRDVVRIVARVVEESTKRPRRAPADFSTGIVDCVRRAF